MVLFLHILIITLAFVYADAINQLESLQDQGVVEFFIMFASKQLITGKKLKYTIDDCHYFCRGAAKKFKSKHDDEPAANFKAVNDGTAVFKLFVYVEYKVLVAGYNPTQML